MHVTFLLGNGFDLNVGLKTSYQDFLNAYPRQEISNKPAIQCKRRFRHGMKINEDKWSDMELALGRLSEEFPEKDESLSDARCRYCALHENLQLALCQYLRIQVKRICVEGNKAAICREFEKTLSCPFRGLQGQQLENMKTWWIKNIRTAVTYHFLNFNYTSTFEQCRSHFESNAFSRKDSPFTRVVGTRTITDTMEVTQHVHGALASETIFGVDHPTQITNCRLRNAAVERKFVKPMINLQLGNGQAEAAEALIRQSKLIVIFGMSMGETDRTWWQIIANWLTLNADNRLIVVKSGPDKNAGIADSVLQWQNETQGVFENLLGVVAWQHVKKQILTTINCKIDPVGKHLFDFSVIKPAPEKVPVKQKLQEAGKAFAASYQQTNQTFRGWIGRRKAFFLRFVGKESTGEEIPIADESPLQEAEAVPMPESRYQTASPFNNPPRSAGQSEDTAP